MVQEIRSLQKLAIFFRVSRWGRRGGACTWYFTVHVICMVRAEPTRELKQIWSRYSSRCHLICHIYSVSRNTNKYHSQELDVYTSTHVCTSLSLYMRHASTYMSDTDSIANRFLVCDVCVGSKVLSIPGGLIMYLFKQLLEER